MKSAALFVVRSPLASMCVGAVLVGLYWASVIVLDGASRGLLAASFLILGTGIGCFTFLCVSQPGWVKENYRSLLTTKNVRLLKHPLVWTSVGRCGSLLMVAGLIWSEGAVVTLLISTGVLVYIPLRNMSSEVVDGGGIVWVVAAGGLLGVWLVGASETGQMFQHVNWGMLLVLGGSVLDGVNVERSLASGDLMFPTEATGSRNRLYGALLAISISCAIVGACVMALALLFQTEATISSFQTSNILLLVLVSLICTSVPTVLYRHALLTFNKPRLIIAHQIAPVTGIIFLLLFRASGIAQVNIARWDYYLLGASLVLLSVTSLKLAKK